MNQEFGSGHVRCEMPNTHPCKAGNWISESGVSGKRTGLELHIWESPTSKCHQQP